MATVKEIYNYFDALLPKSLSCAWDNDGIMLCKNDEKEIKKVLLVLDVTDEAAKYAAENNFDLIISHHPFIFGKISSLYDSALAKRAFLLLDSDISVFSFHTRLDAQNGGINDILAEKIGLLSVEKFGNDEGEMGRVGLLPEKMSTLDFAKSIKSLLGAPYVNSVIASPYAEKIAILGGSGKDFIYDAAKIADTFITGECSYHSLLCAREIGLNIIEAGHFYTEKCACEYFAKHIGEKFPEILVEIPDFKCEIQAI